MKQYIAHSVLHGQPIIPEEVVVGGEQQSFLDARVSPESHGNEYEPSILEAPEPRAADEGTELPFIDWGDDNENLPPIPEDNEGALRPGISDESENMSEGVDAVEEVSRQQVPVRTDGGQVPPLVPIGT